MSVFVVATMTTIEVTYLATVGSGMGVRVGAAILVPRWKMRIDQLLPFDESDELDKWMRVVDLSEAEPGCC
jgi:hypothetical protein